LFSLARLRLTAPL